MPNTKTQKLQAASDGVPGSFCSLVARNQLSLEMGKSTSHAQQVVIMQAALLLFTAPFQMHHPHVKRYQDRKWCDMICGLSKPKTLGRKSWNKKLQSWIGLAFSLATLSYPFVAFVSCAYCASLSFAHSIGIQCYISRLRHQELLRRHQFTLEDSLERLVLKANRRKEWN